MNKSIQKVMSTIQQYMAGEEVLVWHKPYFSAAQANAVSQHEYRGINHLVTSLVSAKEGYSSPYWMTFNQIREKGGTLQDAKGKGVPIVFFKDLSDPNEDDPNTKRRFVLKHSCVFNVDLVEGVALTVDPLPGADIATDANAESLIASYLAREKIQVTQAMKPAYVPATDTIRMPPKEHFISQAELYSTWAHEIAHSTGHNKRLNRFDVDAVRFESKEEFSIEECLAEFCSAQLCHTCGVDSQASIKNSAAYIKGWSRFIKDEPQAFVQAVNQAYKARDFILNHNEPCT